MEPASSQLRFQCSATAAYSVQSSYNPLSALGSFLSLPGPAIEGGTLLSERNTCFNLGSVPMLSKNPEINRWYPSLEGNLDRKSSDSPQKPQAGTSCKNIHDRVDTTWRIQNRDDFTTCFPPASENQYKIPDFLNPEFDDDHECPLTIAIREARNPPRDNIDNAAYQKLHTEYLPKLLEMIVSKGTPEKECHLAQWINNHDDYGFTMLMNATRHGALDCIEPLVFAGASPIREIGITSLHEALVGEMNYQNVTRYQILDKLLTTLWKSDQANFEDIINKKLTPIQKSANYKHYSEMQQCQTLENTVLHQVLYKKDINIEEVLQLVKLLLSFGANPLVKNASGKNVFDYARLVRNFEYQKIIMTIVESMPLEKMYNLQENLCTMDADLNALVQAEIYKKKQLKNTVDQVKCRAPVSSVLPMPSCSYPVVTQPQKSCSQSPFSNINQDYPLQSGEQLRFEFQSVKGACMLGSIPAMGNGIKSGPAEKPISELNVNTARDNQQPVEYLLDRRSDTSVTPVLTSNTQHGFASLRSYSDGQGLVVPAGKMNEASGVQKEGRALKPGQFADSYGRYNAKPIATGQISAVESPTDSSGFLEDVSDLGIPIVLNYWQEFVEFLEEMLVPQETETLPVYPGAVNHFSEASTEACYTKEPEHRALILTQVPTIEDGLEAQAAVPETRADCTSLKPEKKPEKELPSSRLDCSQSTTPVLFYALINKPSTSSFAGKPHGIRSLLVSSGNDSGSELTPAVKKPGYNSSLSNVHHGQKLTDCQALLTTRKLSLNGQKSLAFGMSPDLENPSSAISPALLPPALLPVSIESDSEASFSSDTGSNSTKWGHLLEKGRHAKPNRGCRQLSVDSTKRILGFMLYELGLEEGRRIKGFQWLDKSRGFYIKEQCANKELGRRWGIQKNNPKMTYEKYARALRVYSIRSNTSAAIKHLTRGPYGQSRKNNKSPYYQFNFENKKVKLLLWEFPELL